MLKKYRVTHRSGSYNDVQTTGLVNAAIQKSGFPAESVISVVQMREPGMSWQLLGGVELELTFESGAKLTGNVEQVNFVLGTMGFEPLAIRRNLTTGWPFIEPKNTPNYLSPASEAYWSA